MAKKKAVKKGASPQTAATKKVLKRKRKKNQDPIAHLHDLAMAFPEVEAGTSCNKTAYKARKKSFCFVGNDDQLYNVMLKLTDSLDEALKLEEESPEEYHVGSHGWTTIRLPLNKLPKRDLFEKWIEESFRALAPKTLVAELDATRSI